MKRIKVEAEFKIPGTDIVVEKGDVLGIREKKVSEEVRIDNLELFVHARNLGSGLFELVGVEKVNGIPLIAGILDEDLYSKYNTLKKKFCADVDRLLEPLN